MKKIISVILSVLLLFSCVVTCFASSDADKNKPFENSCFFESGEYTLHYRTYEPESTVKNQIMLFHGFALSTASLEGIAEEYQKNGYRVVTVDMPDFGYSSRETSKTILRDREDIIFELMTALGGTWIVGGHSMGGGIAINLACDHPEIVKGLVLFAPQVNNEMKPPMDKLSSSLPAQLMFEAVVWFALHFPVIVYPMLYVSFSDIDYSNKYDRSRITNPLKIKGTGSGVAIMSSHARTVDYNKLSALEIPTVIITASNDKVASKDVLEKVINNAPEGSVVYNLEKGGHMMFEYSPELVAEKTLPTIELCK